MKLRIIIDVDVEPKGSTTPASPELCAEIKQAIELDPVFMEQVLEGPFEVQVEPGT